MLSQVLALLSASATGDHSLALGSGSTATGEGGVAVGHGIPFGTATQTQQSSLRHIADRSHR